MSPIIRYSKGSNSVLITAPHAFGHRRPNYSGALRPRELFTDQIAEEIGERTGAHVLVTEGDLDYDPNYHQVEANSFKQKIEEIVKSEKVAYIIDLHGLNDVYPYDFAYIFERRYYKSKNVAYEIAQAVNKGSLREAIWQVLYFNESLQESISQFAVRKFHVPSVQIEISQFIRSDESLRNSFESSLEAYILSL